MGRGCAVGYMQYGEEVCSVAHAVWGGGCAVGHMQYGEGGVQWGTCSMGRGCAVCHMQCGEIASRKTTVSGFRTGLVRFFLIFCRFER